MARMWLSCLLMLGRLLFRKVPDNRPPARVGVARIAQTHGIMATTSNPNDYDPPDMAAKRRELELVEQRGDVLHFPDPIPP